MRMRVRVCARARVLVRVVGWIECVWVCGCVGVWVCGCGWFWGAERGGGCDLVASAAVRRSSHLVLGLDPGERKTGTDWSGSSVRLVMSS